MSYKIVFCFFSFLILGYLNFFQPVFSNAFEDEKQLQNTDLNTLPPEVPTNLNPVNGASNVPSTIDLNWSFGANTAEYQLLFGTIYPPTNAVVDWTSNLQTSYALTGLQNNTQYFWKLNVRNEYGVTSGEIWGFVTSLVVPANVTALVHDDSPETATVQVSLSWTASSRSHRGYNIYRNNEKLNSNPYTTTSFTDVSLERNQLYTYYVTAVYDEGESMPSNSVTVEAKGVGTFEGQVIDVLTQEPVQGALLTFQSSHYAITAQTDAEGYYSKKAYKGTYVVHVSKQGYTTQSLGSVLLAHGAIVLNTFYLSEVPYAVSNVVAFSLSNGNVRISWEAPEIPETPQLQGWLTYCSGANYGGIGAGTGTNQTMAVASRWRPTALTPYIGKYLTKIVFFPYSNEAFPTEGSYTLCIWRGNNKNLIYSQPVSAVTYNTWNEVVLLNPIAISATEDLLFGYTVSYSGTAFPCGYDEGPASNGLGNLIQVGNQWYSLSDVMPRMNYDWSLAAYISDEQGDAVACLDNELKPVQNVKTSEGRLKQVSGSIVEAEQLLTDLQKGVRSYNVWRVRQNDQPELLGNTTSTSFTDVDWKSQDWGVYQWFIETKYDLDQLSQPTFSNPLEKDMNTDLHITVNLNSGESQYGIAVTLKNISDPMLHIIMEGRIDSAGKILFDPIRRGVYELTLSKSGFYTRNETIEVFGSTSLFYLMKEKIMPPSALFVSPTAKATWIGEERVFEPRNQSFDQGALINGWKSVTGEASTVPVTWKVVDYYFNELTNEYYNLNGSPFVMVDSDVIGAGETVDSYLLSPVIDASMASSLFLDFDQYLRTRSLTVSRVEVYNGVEWIEVLNQTTNTGSWSFPNHKSIDLSPYVNTRLQICFHYRGSWEYFWALDNVSIYTADSQKEVRSLNYYKIFLDGIFVANTTNEYYQYNTTNLEEGRTYVTEVASYFSTGPSEKSSYLWTYIPCENYDSPASVTAHQLYGTINIEVAWTNADLTHVSYLNIYRNEEQVARIPMETSITSWVDEYLPFGMYQYTLEYEYEDGATNCLNVACSNTVWLRAGGEIEGVVTSILDGQPIEGAIVTASNDYVSFSAESDAEGFYLLEVLDGSYALSAAAPGFDSFTIENISVPYAATVEQNFQLYEYPYPPKDVVAEMMENETVLVTWEQDLLQRRSFVQYKIYRLHLLTAEIVLLDSLETTSFVDDKWDELPVGAYKWGVVACYELNQSEKVYSETLDKEMLTSVTLQVSTNNNDTPEQTRVCFVNTKEPDADIELFLDETGYYTFEAFRKGIYDITLLKHNYEPILVNNMAIMEATDLVYTLIEEILPVKDLYVGTTGYAKWKCPGYAPFAGFSEDFDFEISEFWDIESGGATDHTWSWKESTPERFMLGSPYITVDSDALGESAVMDEKITSPKIDVSICHTLYLSFYQHYRVASEDEFSQIEVFDGAEWVCIRKQTETAGSWDEPVLTEIDVTSYINENFQVRFHYYSPGWNWYWAIDDIKLVGSSTTSTPVRYYKIWLDGLLISDTENTYYQHEDISFVEGENYVTEVQAVYATGESTKVAFEWTYEPCAHFLGATEFGAAIVSMNNVLLTWINPVTDIFSDHIQNRNQTVFNQADFITHQGVGANGADVSALYDEALLYGAPVNYEVGNKVADDFELVENTFVEQIEFYAYQTGSSLSSTITGVYVALFDSNPSDGGQLVWGNPDENVIRSTAWSGVYRTSALDFINTDRPVMKVVANVNTILPAGNYWVVVSFSGTMESGPLVVPRQILGQVNTGNALLHNNSGWSEWIDSGSGGQMGLPLIVRGTPEGTFSDKSLIGANIYRDGELIATLLQEEHYMDRNVGFGNHNYCIALVYEDYAMSCLGTNCIDIRLDFPCWKPYNLDAAYVFYEGAIAVQLTWQWEPAMKINASSSGYVLTAFNIYRKSGGENFELLTQMSVTGQKTTYEYMDYELDPQTAFYYQVKAVYEYTGGDCESNAAPSLHNPDEDFVIVIVTSTGEESAHIPVTVYPNPTNDKLNIAGEEISHVRCINMLGELLFETATDDCPVQFDVSSLKQGIYLLQIYTANGIVTKRFVVSK